MVRVTCLGGAGSVTGSCYLVETPGGDRMVVDCGLFQGGRRMEKRNREPWGFDPKEIPTLFLTHAHIDHSGRIPKLVKDGFRGRIITSPPTAELCGIMLLDAAHIQEMDAEWQNRKMRRKGGAEEILPLYTQEDAEASLSLLEPVERETMVTLGEEVRARLRNAGHILGSAILELWVGKGDEAVKIVFSGDLGKRDQLILKDAAEIFNADYLFLESTYGNRKHRGLEDSKEELLEAIHYSISHGQKILIPAFAVERTQEILYLLAEFHREGRIPGIPVFLDSPLAIKATEIFRKNKQHYDAEAMAVVDRGYDPLDIPGLRFTASTEESRAINQVEGPAIIIAGNGMCTAGRIKHHLKHHLWREGASLVIVGYQAQGTTGRLIVDGAKHVKIFGEPVAVRAKVFTIGGFSAHADQDDLLEWVSHFESHPKVFLVHGERTASEVLAQLITQRFGLETHIPRWKERLVLRPREMAVEVEPPEEEPAWRDLFLEALSGMEEDLLRLRRGVEEGRWEGSLGEEAVDRLHYLRQELGYVLE